jgi:hypothetical protein
MVISRECGRVAITGAVLKIFAAKTGGATL